MQDQLDHVVYDFLRMQHIHVSKTYLTKQLTSHPEPNSLLSITDTLDELDIPYEAARIQKQQLPQVPLPFLVHIRSDNGQFVIVKELKPNDSWTHTWTGAVLVVERPEKTAGNNVDNIRMLTKEKRNKALTTAFILSGLVLLAYPLLSHFSFAAPMTIIGLFLSILILQKEAGVHNHLVDQLCHDDKNDKTRDCNTVLGSNASSWLKLSDMTFIYFGGQQFIFLSIYSRSPTQITAIFSLLAACSLPVTFFSLYYQGIVLRKWCTLCLAIIAVLWLQFLLLIPDLKSLTAISPNTAIPALAVFILTGTGWLLLKQAILGKADLEQQLLRAWRLKRDSRVFANLIQDRKKIDETPFKDEIELGSPEKPVRILAVFNPYCKPCANEYRQLEKLLDNNSPWFSLTIRFTMDANLKDHRAEAVRYLFQYKKSNKTKTWRQLIHSWYDIVDFDSFKATHPLTTFPDVEPILQQHSQWTHNEKLYSTPALFLNGHEFPRQYTIPDLPLLRPVIEKSLTKEPPNQPLAKP